MSFIVSISDKWVNIIIAVDTVHVTVPYNSLNGNNCMVDIICILNIQLRAQPTHWIIMYYSKGCTIKGAGT